MWDTVVVAAQQVWSLISAVGSVGWFILNQLFNLPLGVGFILHTAFWLGIFWLVYRYMPRSVRETVWQTTKPALWSTTTPIRWFLVYRILANPEWLRTRDDSGPQIIEKEIVVYQRRTFKEWLYGTLWAMGFGAALVLLAQNHTTVFPVISRLVQ